MKYLVSGKEMKRYDTNTMQYFFMKSCVLMERAALSCADIIEQRFGQLKSVLIVAGTGNNGGDGIALGRILWQRGYAVTFCFLGDEEKATEETKQQLEIIKKYNLSIQTNIPDNEYDIVIDAILGIGLSRPLTGVIKESVEQLNVKKGVHVALDIPTGVCADTGKLFGTAFKADITITFAYEKIGLCLYPGAKYCGTVICTSIGITNESFLGEPPEAVSYDLEDLRRLPKRRIDGNKGTFGKVLLIAGSTDMNGAAVLAAKSAYRMGAGMVRLVTKEENKGALLQAIPELLLTTYQSETLEKRLVEAMLWADVIAVGPGLSRCKELDIIMEYLGHSEKVTVYDADALNWISNHPEWLIQIKGKKVIFTPHVAEFMRLCGKTKEEFAENRIDMIKQYVTENQMTLVCKDAVTIVAKEGTPYYINRSGNEGMATAGSGDVLTGMIAALAAQGLGVVEAARMGVYLHGLVGDEAKKKTGSYAVMAGDLIEELKYFLEEKRRTALEGTLFPE